MHVWNFLIIFLGIGRGHLMFGFVANRERCGAGRAEEVN